MFTYSPLEIARREEARQAAGTAAIADEHLALAGGYACWSGPGAWDNFAAGLGLQGPVTDPDLDALCAFYEARHATPAIEVAPYADPSLVAGLARRGFTIHEFENVFARQHLHELDPAPHLPNLRLQPVDPRDPPTVRTFAEISASGFVPADTPLSPVHLRAWQRTLEHPECAGVLAFLDDQPVAAAGLQAAPDVACLFGATVLPHARRLGIQAALIRWRAAHAHARGCPLLTIHTAPGIPTERNALRLGFSLAYTKVILHRTAPST